MTNLPSLNTHPVITALITMVLLIAVLIAGVIGGWTLRAMSESRAELSVVVDDGNFMRALEQQTQKWVDEFNLFDEKFHEEHEIPDCIAKPMPSFYHDNDYLLRAKRE